MKCVLKSRTKTIPWKIAHTIQHPPKRQPKFTSETKSSCNTLHASVVRRRKSQKKFHGVNKTYPRFFFGFPMFLHTFFPPVMCILFACFFCSAALRLVSSHVGITLNKNYKIFFCTTNQFVFIVGQTKIWMSFVCVCVCGGSGHGYADWSKLRDELWE